MFNMLFSLNAIDDAVVVDLYAGSGSLGIEALSRGAKSCIFVEQDREALDAIGENIDTVGYGDRAVIVAGDVENWLTGRAAQYGPFDLILADPPYKQEPWELFLEHIGSEILSDGGLLVAESHERLDEHKEWDVVRDKKYGTTLVTVLTRKERDGTGAHS